jgi:hypothetical protein
VFVKGLISDVLRGPGDFDSRIAALDEEDFRDWLARHGAGRWLRDSPPVRGIYDLAFAYPDGDCGHPGASAAIGVARPARRRRREPDAGSSGRGGGRAL